MTDQSRNHPASNETLRIREFVEPDRENLRQIFLASRIATFTWQDPSSFQLHDFDTATAGELILLAERNQLALGFISIWQAGNFIHNLFVHPSALNQGVGRALLNAASAYFSQAPTLKCLQANQHALGFYQHQGWRIRDTGLADDGQYFLLIDDQHGD